MNKISEMVMPNNMSDERLESCILELFHFHDKGILEDGLVRRFANEIVEKIGESVMPYKIKIAEDTLFREAARRWLFRERN